MSVINLSADKHLELIQLNIVSLTLLCKLFGTNMVKRRCGSIFNVASTAAFQTGPLMSTYYASKAYVLLLFEGLNNEFAQNGVNVTELFLTSPIWKIFDRNIDQVRRVQDTASDKVE